MKNKTSFAVLACTFWLSIAIAQVPDSVFAPQMIDFQEDTTQVEIATTDSLPPAETTKQPGRLKRFFSKLDYPNPNKAIYLSLAVPGGGQFYNKRYWKVPIIYGGYAALIYSASYNGRNYRSFRAAYIAELKGEEHEYSGLGLNANDLRRFRDRFDKRTQLSYIGIFALHLVQSAEAFVDCHLKTFDVSDDLSLKFGPSFQARAGMGVAPGVGVSLVFR